MRPMKQNYESELKIFVNRVTEVDPENAADLVAQITRFGEARTVNLADIEVTYEQGAIMLECWSLETDVEFEYRQKAIREANERANKNQIATEKRERALYLKLKKKFEKTS